MIPDPFSAFYSLEYKGVALTCEPTLFSSCPACAS